MRLKFEERRPVPAWLADLEMSGSNPLDSIAFPLHDVLHRSLYYPASRFDGRPVQLLAGMVHSFVYVDYGVDYADLEKAVRSCGFLGYRLAAQKTVKQADLAPHGWQPEVPDKYRQELKSANHSWIRPFFAQWMVFERLSDFKEEHGPARFSLLYIGADGVQTYQALYVTNSIAPLVLAIIQPGHAFGNNYTDFTDPEGLLAHVVCRTNDSNLPEYMVCGQGGERLKAAFWTDTYPESVENWYLLGVWQRSQMDER